MLFGTKEEYLRFIDAMMDKPMLYYAFEVLYWCGIREGELLALTPVDFDFEKQTLRISKSYQHLKGKDVITSPKTKKSNRVGHESVEITYRYAHLFPKMISKIVRKKLIFTANRYIIEASKQ